MTAAAAPLVLPSRVCAADPQAPSNRFNIALIGCGGRGNDILREAIGNGANVIALCDADAARIANTRKSPGRAEIRPEVRNRSRGYEDYRELIDKEKSLDGVLIAVGPWWHAPLSTAFIKAGKHVYCEKPLTRLVSEARALGQLAKESKVTTQMGTQGAASESFRRAVEIIQAGLLGQIREVHVWHANNPGPKSHARPAGEDPVPAGFNWDLWVGPAPLRPYKKDVYQPGCRRTSWWFDFGAWILGDFGVHTWQLPIRALKLNYPVRVEHNVPEPVLETFVSTTKIRYEFAARGDLAPVTAWDYDSGNLPAERGHGRRRGGLRESAERGRDAAGRAGHDVRRRLGGGQPDQAQGRREAARRERPSGRQGHSADRAAGAAAEPHARMDRSGPGRQESVSVV